MSIRPRRPKKPDRFANNLTKQQSAVFAKVHAEAGDPDADNDIDEGYKVGDIWVNTGDDGTFICTDNTDGAAVWREITFV